MRSATAWLGSLAAMLAATAVIAADVRDAASVPHLGPAGVDGYRAFLAAEPHRAFAIAPGGAWAWRGDMTTPELAEQAALDACREQTQQDCVSYALDSRVVFDAAAWPSLWGPYAGRVAAARAKVGVRRGERFPDLAFADAAGRAYKVSDFRGKVLFLHFWGSWCGPCRRELPDLQGLVRRMSGVGDVRFVFLPVRESFATARDWARGQKLELPLFDSGMGENATTFRLADGGSLPDRQVAGKFPTTYVLDKHGLVLFSHSGDASRWHEYASFLTDAARRSGK